MFSPYYKYGFLGLILLLLAWQIRWFLNLPPSYPYDKYDGFCMLSALLLNHLAFYFSWPRRIRIALVTAALGWAVLILIYFFYLSHR